MNIITSTIIILIAVAVGLGMWFFIPWSVRDSAPTETSQVPTSADNAPPGSIHNLPVPAPVAAARAEAAREYGVLEGEAIVMTAYEREWSDSCLGLGGPTESCLQAITPGWEVSVQVKGTLHTYRTDASGSSIREQR
jgi:hypothetical protein